MNGEDSQSDRDGAVEADDNVVRLTDWLGPREELIPFGPGADAEEAKPPPTADDFWSESSGAVQDAFAAPHADRLHKQHSGAQPSGGTSPPRGRASASAIWSRRRAKLQSRAAGWNPPHLGHRLSRARKSSLALVTALVLVAAVAAAGVVRLGAGGQPANGSSHSSPAGSDRAWNIATASANLLARRGSDSGWRPPAHHRAADRRRPSGQSARSHHSAPASAPTVQPVGYTTPASSGTTGSAPAASATTPRSAPSTSTPAPTASAGHTGGAAAQPALGANGSLAPGSSPDG